MPFLLFAGEKISPIRINDEHWQDDWGHKFDARRALSTGHAQEARFAPKCGISSIDLENLPSFLPLPYWLCNNEVRDLIEKFEPGRHNFLPYEIQREGAPSETTNYNLINLCDPIPALDIKSTSSSVLTDSNRISVDGYNVYTLKTLNIKNRGMKLYTEQKRQLGRHVWNDAFTQNYSQLFISNEFYKEISSIWDENYFSIVKTHEGGHFTRILNRFSRSM